MRVFLLAAVFAGLGLAVLAPSRPAWALDCAKAATLVEKSICASQDLRLQDVRINEAFDALKKRKSVAEARLLVASQRDWIASRETDCLDPQAKSGPALIGGCVGGGMEVRRRFLAGEPETGAGTSSSLWPWFRRSGDDEIDIGYAYDPPKSASEIALNAAVKALLSQRESSQDHFEMRYAYGSSRLVSLHAEGAWEGGAHPMPWTADINFDVEHARLYTISDAFDAAALKTLRGECHEQIADAMKTEDEDIAHERAKTFETIVGNLGRWSLAADRATIAFVNGEINDYTEGDLECHFPASRFNELSKPDFWKF